MLKKGLVLNLAVIGKSAPEDSKNKNVFLPHFSVLKQISPALGWTGQSCLSVHSNVKNKCWGAQRVQSVTHSVINCRSTVKPWRALKKQTHQRVKPQSVYNIFKPRVGSVIRLKWRQALQKIMPMQVIFQLLQPYSTSACLMHWT